MKLTNRHVMQILRLYQIAKPDEPQRSIRNLRSFDEDSFVRVSLTLSKQNYMIIFGANVDDESIADLWPDMPEGAVALNSPKDPDETVTPFNGKYLVVYHLPSKKQRLDIFLSTAFDPTVSRSKWQKYIKLGCVTVNGEVKLSPNEEVGDTDDIAVKFPTSDNSDHDLPIIYQDEDVVVIDKPSGVLTHAKGGISSENTVADFMKSYTSFGLDTDRAGIIHRLDRDTSGVIICARNSDAAKFLQKQFSERKAEKLYIAVVEGHPKLDRAKIDLPIGRNPSKPSTFRVDSSGKSAETVYRVLSKSSKQSLVELRPTTGRTHQLRVHMSHIGTPIVGDRVYGKSGNRLMLHAHQLTCVLPSGEKKTFTSPVPELFKNNFTDIKL